MVLQWHVRYGGGGRICCAIGLMWWWEWGQSDWRDHIGLMGEHPTGGATGLMDVVNGIKLKERRGASVAARKRQ